MLAKILASSVYSNILGIILNPQEMNRNMMRASLFGLLIFFPAAILSNDSLGKSSLAVDLETFTQVIEYVKNYYVESVDDTALFQNATRGIMEGLDPHSAYLDRDEFDELKINVTGELGGLGVKVMPDGGFIRVMNTLDASPAERVGIKSGDWITHLNDVAVNELTPREAVKRMRGKKGTQINITIIRNGEAKPLKLNVIRDNISVCSVRSEILDKHFGYLKVSEFQTHSGEDVTRAILALKKNNAGKLKGFILDLRNNPGGVVESAVEIADTFLDSSKLKKYEGIIVYAKGRTPRSRFKERAHGGDILNGIPLVVLVNHASASASEIVAGALQDYNRAIIMGTQTFGKGSVQTVIPLKEDEGLKLTTALYYTPSGRSIQATGIIPDISVHNIKIPEINTTKKDNKKPVSLLSSDNQLNQALNVLKGVSLMNSEKT